MATRAETLQGSPAVARQRLRTLAIVPAYNEEHSIGTVLEEIRAADVDLHVVVVNDASEDGTAAIAARGGAAVLNLPFNVGIGGAMQAGYQYALEHGFELAIQVDGDGQHDPREIGRVLEPILDGRADLVVGTRFVKGGGYRGTPASPSRDPNFRCDRLVDGGPARQRHDIGFPGGQPEGAAPLCGGVPARLPGGGIDRPPLAPRAASSSRCRCRCGCARRGNSSITALRSVYYMIKVLLALFIGLFRRYPTPTEEP